MRSIRWVLVLLYVLTILTLTAMGLWVQDLQKLTLIGLLVLIVSQAVLLKAAGTSDLCTPVRPRRLVVPVAIAGLMMAALVAALVLALAELIRHEFIFYPGVFWAILGASWVFGSVVFFFYTRRVERYRVLKRLTATVLAGSLLELLATVPSHFIVSRRSGCLVGLFTGMGITSGLYVMLWAFGPGIVLLFLQAKHRAEQARLTPTPPPLTTPAD